MQHPQAGFTLIELMIVTAIVSVLAGVAVPNLVSSRAIANERAVVATLRTIVTAQIQTASRQVVDANGNGTGEALGLGELAGTTGLRGSGVRLAPPSLAQSLGTLDSNGHATSKGYLLALYLPDSSGNGVIATSDNDSNVDASLAEQGWTCLAWPVTHGRTGASAFFVNQMGEILVARDANYNGTVLVPPPGAGLTGVAATAAVGGELAVETIGADGNFWRALR